MFRGYLMYIYILAAVDVDAVLWLAAETEVDVPTPEFLSQICMGKKAIFGAKVQKIFLFLLRYGSKFS